LLPFSGVAHIAYIPKASILGLSKFARIVDAFARRINLQERLTKDIANYIDDILKPNGVLVYIECRHACMRNRGVE
jgi:GTP cyclohydrolase I